MRGVSENYIYIYTYFNNFWLLTKFDKCMQLIMIYPAKDFEAQDYSAQLKEFRVDGQGDGFQVV